MTERHDLILVGGGLANGLIAYRFAQRRPELRVLVIETGSSFGGDHTWSFHETDLSAEQRSWTAPFVAHRWPFYRVAFPGLHRRVDLPYASATSAQFHAVLSDAGIPVRFDAEVAAVAPQSVRLASGETLEASAVVDGRGYTPSPHLRLGWQKFVGLEIRTSSPHRVASPVVMDASVAQHDGLRFVYVLPFTDDRLLVEDTYYSDDPTLDRETVESRALDYVYEKGWPVDEIVRRESGVLPITLSGDAEAFWREKDGQPCAGLRAGLFHPTTGFSWPDAVRFADHLAGLRDLDATTLFNETRAYATRKWRAQAFFRGLDRLLFLAGDPNKRWATMQRFYGLGDALIARFYAGSLTSTDKARILIGRPPVPVGAAIRALLEWR